MLTNRWSKTCKSIGVTGALLLSLFALSGCENAYHFGSFALGSKDGEVVVVSCEAIVVDTLYMEERSDSPGNDGRRHVWEASGQRKIAPGDMLSVGGENVGLANDLLIDFKLEPGYRYFFESSDGSRDTSSALFEIPDGGIPAGMWLDAQGEVLPEPCQASGGQ